MRIISLLLVFAVIVVVASCTKPTIDASSEQSMKESINNVRASLPENKRDKFDRALTVVAFSQLNMKDLMSQQSGSGINTMSKKVRATLDGKTGQQVIIEAEKIQAEKKARERKQALNKIKELQNRRAKAEKAREKLKQFRIIQSRFYTRKHEFMGEQPIIELTVKNGLDQAVSRAYFEGTLASPGRSVPWHEGTFNYKISGGIEPGEKKTWKLSPNMFSDWGKVDAPKDAVLTVTVERLDDANNEPIYSVNEFTQKDQNRLDELKKKYEVNS